MTDISKLVKTLKKKYGSMRIVGEKEDTSEYISTGNYPLDLALEGGIAWGYATEWSGKSGSGKTLMLQKMLADAQKKYNAIGVWFDREKAFFRERAEELEIDIDNTIIIDPEDMSTVGEAEEIAKDVLSGISSDRYKFIAIDSISAFAKEGDKADMGKKAKSLHELFRSIIPFINDKSSLNFTNQRTFKIGILFGNPETTTGGEGPKYYCTYRIKLDDKREIIDENKGKEIVGNWIKANIIKTRRGPNHRSVAFPFFYKEGIPYMGGYIRLLADRGYLKAKNEKDFASFKQGLALLNKEIVDEFKVEEFLEKHPELKFDKYPEYNIKEKKEE